MKTFGIRAALAAALSTAMLGILYSGRKSEPEPPAPTEPTVEHIVYAGD